MKIKLLLLLLCLFAGNAFATPTTPTSDFIDNRDGTVTHKTTGLTWMRCALGQTWTGSACSGTASTYTYDQAVALTGTFAGHSDWRVPNIAELQTLVERENMNPTINTDLFPNSHSQTFWSSSPYVGSTNYAWDVDFYDGDVGRDLILRSLPVRLVRASQSLGIGLSTPNTDFTDNKDGTVTHKRTGLVWQRCAVGQTWTGSTCSGSANTYTYDAAQQVTSSLAGYSDWRVPTANELAGIVKYDAYYPAINRRMFPNTPSNAFWSSSPNVGDSDVAWYVSFNDGVVYDYGYRNRSLPVRLVRASQSSVIGPKPDLDTTMTATTARVKLNQNLTYTATVTNQGTAAATNTTLIFYFPPRWTNYVTVPSDCVSNGTSYRCSVATLAAGASLSKAITVNYARRGALNVVALGITDSDDADAANNKAQVMTTITP